MHREKSGNPGLTSLESFVNAWGIIRFKLSARKKYLWLLSIKFDRNVRHLSNLNWLRNNVENHFAEFQR
jgi:hypothetical protein